MLMCHPYKCCRDPTGLDLLFTLLFCGPCIYVRVQKDIGNGVLRGLLFPCCCACNRRHMVFSYRLKEGCPQTYSFDKAARCSTVAGAYEVRL